MRERPSSYDGTQFVVSVDLPPGEWTTAHLYGYMYGVRLDDGAKPWPYYRDLQTKEWWSLSTPDDCLIDATGWMIDLAQLAYKTPSEAQIFLHAVLLELEERAARFGGSIEAESTVAEALAKMNRVEELLKVRNYRATIIVAATERGAFSVDEWCQALEGVGLKYGDGNLFWLYDEDGTEDDSELQELFCAEPYSRPGYFHPGDWGGPVNFPDVALHFRVRDVSHPMALLRRMTGVAEQMSAKLGAILLNERGGPFKLAAAEADLTQVLKELQAIQDA